MFCLIEDQFGSCIRMRTGSVTLKISVMSRRASVSSIASLFDAATVVILGYDGFLVPLRQL